MNTSFERLPKHKHDEHEVADRFIYNIVIVALVFGVLFVLGVYFLGGWCNSCGGYYREDGSFSSSSYQVIEKGMLNKKSGKQPTEAEYVVYKDGLSSGGGDGFPYLYPDDTVAIRRGEQLHPFTPKNKTAKERIMELESMLYVPSEGRSNIYKEKELRNELELLKKYFTN